MSLSADFGDLDIYLFDQLLKGRITKADRIFDAGCGMGRNLVYLLRQGYDVSGIDADPDAVSAVRALAGAVAPALPPDRFRAEPLDRHSFPDGFATVVISSAVLHFAETDAMFDAMLEGSWRVLAPGGMFFCRLASTIGLESRVRRLEPGTRRHVLPDGTTRFLVDHERLLNVTRELDGSLLDPLKSTVVHEQRSMGTWVVRKRSPGT